MVRARLALMQETRPVFVTRYELRRLRRFGCTRVQIGVQHVDDSVLQYINRGCTRHDAIKAIRMLKDSGFKVSLCTTCSGVQKIAFSLCLKIKVCIRSLMAVSRYALIAG